MTQLHPDVLELAELLRAQWPAARQRIALSGHPTCEEKDEDEKEEDDKDDDVVETDDDVVDEDDKPSSPEPNWKQQARRHEREAKAARKREADLQTKLKERDDADKSEQDKAIDKARTDATKEVSSKYELERRAERLELAVTRIAVGKGVTIGEGDKQKTVKFTDAEDVQMWVERQVKNGNIDADEIYDENGKVNAEALSDSLAQLAASKPSWLQGAPAAKGPDFDGGKGKGSAKGVDDLSVEEHYKRMQLPAR